MSKAMELQEDTQVIHMVNGAAVAARGTDADMEVIHMVNDHAARNRAAAAQRAARAAQRRQALEEMNVYPGTGSVNAGKHLRAAAWFGVGILFLGAARWELMETWMGIALGVVCFLRALTGVLPERKAGRCE